MNLAQPGNRLEVSFIIAVLLSPLGITQTGERDIILKTFRDERPAQTEVPAPRKSSPKPAARKAGSSIVGVTLWKMRQATASDSNAVKFRGLVHDREQPDDQKEWTAERVSLGTPVTAGQYVRLSIESARLGYLYVIDRDMYGDGTTGPPRLIFPTLRLRGGDNRVQPGATIEIPDGQDRPPVFRLEKTRTDQASVLVTVIVAPQPIGEIRPARDTQKLTNQQVETWEKRWGSKTERVENAATLGKAYTPVEQASAQPNSRPLGRNDPLPQTLIKAKSGAGQPMLVSVPIKMQ